MRFWTVTGAVLIICLGVLSTAAMAETSYFADDVEQMLRYSFQSFVSEARTMESRLTTAASRLFWGLCLIGLALKGVELIFKEDGSIQTFFGAFVQMVVIIGIFEFLLSHGSEIGIAVIESLMELPEGSNPITPVDLLNKVMSLNNDLSRVKGGGSFADDLLFLLLQVFVSILLFLCVINYAILYLSAYILCVAGIVVLGFGAFVYTRPFAVNYLRLLLSLGMQLMVMILVCTSGMSTITNVHTWVVNYSGSYTLNDMLLMLFVVMLFFAMTRSLPALAAGLVAGGGGAVMEGRSGFNQAAAIAWAPVAATLAYIARKLK